MAKASGLGWTVCSLDDGAGAAQAIINDVTEVSFATPREVYDWTGLDKSAYERGLGLADFSGSLKGIWNPAASPGAHGVLKTVPSTSTVRTLTLTVSAVTLACETVVTNYELERAQDGQFTWTAPFELTGGAVPTWA